MSGDHEPKTLGCGAVADDRWWRGFDAVVVDALAAGSRVLDVGCGDGGLVDELVACGLDAFGIDPGAPQRERLIPSRVEEVGRIGSFDAVCAVMTLHHAELEPALRAISRLLRPGGRVFVYEVAWEAYDERAASWLRAHDPSESDYSVSGWRLEHRDLHTGAALRSSISAALDLGSETARPYLARMLGDRDLEEEEQAMIAAAALPALGRWYRAAVRS